MKKLYSCLIVFALLFPFLGFSQGDFCGTAVSITPSFTQCNYIAGSSTNSTQSLPTCSNGGNADDDVWYTFVANAAQMSIKVNPSSGYDAVIELFSAPSGCSSLSSLKCQDVNGLNGVEKLNIFTLTPGNTYYTRVYHYGVGSGSGSFDICISGLAPATNNTPCNAMPLPAVTPNCDFDVYTNYASVGSSVPTPASCGGSSPFQGGYQGGDVWFSVVVPPSGKLDIHTQEIDFADGAMALYGGTCGSPVRIDCDDDGGVGSMPYIYQTGLTPGATMFIRMWEYGNNNNGKFGICVSTPDNDDCVNAQDICDLDGYGGVTSSAYLVDRPDNMSGTGENPPGVFGTGYTGSSPVEIDNNSWLTFTASSATAKLFVQVNDCAKGHGMQMQIFGGNNCSAFFPVSNFLETSTSQTITANGLIPGNKYYLVIDGFAGDICSYTITATSGVQVVQAVASATDLCVGDSTTISVQVSGGNTGLSYNWSSNPGTFSGTNQSYVVHPTQSTQYSVDVNGFCGKTTKANVYIKVNTPPTVSITSGSSVCVGQSTKVVANPVSGTAPYSHLWTGSSDLSSTTVVGPGFTPSAAGSYNLIYEVTDSKGCVAKDSVTVVANTPPTAAISSPATVCSGELITLNGSGGGDYLWSDGSTNSSTTITPIAQTVVSLYVKDPATGCLDTADQTIQVWTIPTVAIGGDLAICNGSPANLTASGAASYTWSTGQTTPSITVNPVSNTVYTVYGTDANGCKDTATATVNTSANPTATINGSPEICEGAALTLTASGGSNYVWDNGGNTAAISISPTVTTTYEVIATIGTCKDTVQHQVVVNPLPNISLSGPSTICAGDPVTITASGTGSFAWNTGATAPSITESPNSTTVYSVNITDANLCTNSSSMNVTVKPTPVIVINAKDSICAGDTVALTASGANTYAWSTGQTTAVINILPGSTATYTVTGTSVANCSASTQHTIKVLPQPNVSISGTSVICDNQSAQLTAQGANSYVWSTLEVTPSIDVMPSVQTTYKVYGYINSCIDSATYTVNVKPLPAITTVGDTLIYLGQTADISASGTGPFFWYPNTEISCVNCASAEVKPKQTTFYCAIAELNGCKDTSCVEVRVDQTCGDVFVPTAFSPNEDGKNDCLTVHSNCMETIVFTVFSRWGEVIFTSDEVGDCWDGTYKGKDMNTGVYVYTIEGELMDGTDISMSGNVSLFR